jgi:probable FeS assembly SUF system protein SufT
MSDNIVLNRDVDVTQIPSGMKHLLPRGTTVSITQSLGGSHTVVYGGGMARIDEKDGDALGLEVKKAEAVIPEGPLDEKACYTALKKVYDPEIPVNIVDLGLVYDCALDDLEDGKKKVSVKMTLTAPGCGMGPAIAADAKGRLMAIPGVGDAQVDLIWDPPWTQSMISEVGKMQLGLI